MPPGWPQPAAPSAPLRTAVLPSAAVSANDRIAAAPFKGQNLWESKGGELQLSTRPTTTGWYFVSVALVHNRPSTLGLQRSWVHPSFPFEATRTSVSLTIGRDFELTAVKGSPNTATGICSTKQSCTLNL